MQKHKFIKFVCEIMMLKARFLLIAPRSITVETRIRRRFNYVRHVKIDNEPIARELFRGSCCLSKSCRGKWPNYGTLEVQKVREQKANKQIWLFCPVNTAQHFAVWIRCAPM
jgi:hypothetical protein